MNKEEELKAIEDKILGSEEKVVALEYDEFTKIRNEIARNIERLQNSASAIANVDVLMSLAIVAEDNNYVCPIINDENVLNIKGGRHPVVEKMVDSGTFVENDTYLDCDKTRVAIITALQRHKAVGRGRGHLLQ